jgi:hypothetical protein
MDEVGTEIDSDPAETALGYAASDLSLGLQHEVLHVFVGEDDGGADACDACPDDDVVVVVGGGCGWG